MHPIVPRRSSHQALDILQRALHVPASPVGAFVPAKGRRQMRRSAARLRAGKSQPRYLNLHSAEELAGVYERTVRRDELLEEAVQEFRQVTLELGRIMEQNDPAVRAALDALVRDTERAAEEAGPGSAAAERYQQLLLLGVMGQQWHLQRRRQRGRQRASRPATEILSMASDPSIEARYAVSAAELLATPPRPDVPVVAIPPEGGGSGRERMFLRTGTGASSWVGSFESGDRSFSTVFLMPDGKHLLVSAGGAGHVIEARSRTLVETVGTDVAGIVHDKAMTRCVVDHGGRGLELFDRTGRRWKAERISSGGFRQLHFSDDALLGEARQWWRAEWVRFSVNLATGAVRVGRASHRGPV